MPNLIPKYIHTQVDTILPNPESEIADQLDNWEDLKQFIEERYGTGGTNNPPSYSYVFDDVTRTCILTSVVLKINDLPNI